MQNNLDWKAQVAAQEINAKGGLTSGDIDTLATKALGVLQENGIYASMLFLFSRTRPTDRDVAKQIRATLVDLAREMIPGKPAVRADIVGETLKYVTTHVCSNLDLTLLIRSLWEQTLIYTRYGAKSIKACEKVQG